MEQTGKFNRFLEEKIMPGATKIGQQKHLIALRDGISMTIPVIIVGSIFLLLASLPFGWYQSFLNGVFGPTWPLKLYYAVYGTYAIMGLVASYSIAYCLAGQYKIDQVTTGIISLSCFILTIPVTEGTITISSFGSSGLFVAMLIAILITEVTRVLVKHNITIKLPDTVPPAVVKSFSALIPCLICVLIVWGIRLTVEMSGLVSIQALITTVLGAPLKKIGTGYIGGLIVVIVTSLFWSVGIHGGNIVASVMTPILLTSLDENRVALEAGKELPHIITNTFYGSMLWVGGSGCLLGLAIVVTFMCKSARYKELGKIGFVSTIFTINEPFMFGLPVILNPVLLIPYFIVPIINYNIIYWGMYFGLVAKTTGIEVPWCSPALFNAFLATGGRWSGVVVQLITIIVSVVIYYPFMMSLDRIALKEEQGLAE